MFVASAQKTLILVASVGTVALIGNQFRLASDPNAARARKSARDEALRMAGRDDTSKQSSTNSTWAALDKSQRR